MPDTLMPGGAIAQLGERLNGIQEVGGSIPPGSTNLRRFAAIVDGNLKPPSAHTVQKSGPIIPTGAVAWIAGLLDNAEDPFQGLKVFGVLS